MGPSSLILKQWAINFDPSRDPFSLKKVWDILHNLLLVFWKEDILKSIGNKIGSFCSFKPDWDTKMDKRWA